MEKVHERIEVELALNEVDIKSVKKSPFYDMSDFRNVYVKAQTDILEADKKVTLTFLQADNKLGTKAKELGKPLEVMAKEADNQTLELEMLANQMDTNNGFRYVGFSLKSDNSAAIKANAVLILGNKRHI